MIPEIPEGTNKLICDAEPNSTLIESYRILRSNISFSAVDRQLKILAISSPGRSEGKSTTAANLAVAMAMDGKKVLLMDCDLRRPSQHKVFGIPRDVGFSNAVTGACKLSDAIMPTSVENLSIMPSGPIPPNPSEILNSVHSRQLFTDVADRYDLVIVDCPPCTGLSDVQVVSTIADGLLLLVCMDRTLKPALHMTLRTLRQVEAPLIGVVINRMELRRQGYYSYYNYYYYSYDYTNDGDQASSHRRTRHKRRKERGKSTLDR
jgi:capsular exopolysaccharide synthesis family protein